MCDLCMMLLLTSLEAFHVDFVSGKKKQLTDSRVTPHLGMSETLSLILPKSQAVTRTEGSVNGKQKHVFTQT